MNKVVIVGAIVVVVAVIAAGVVLVNHLPNSSSSQPNVPYNTFYLLNQTGPFSNYIFVISYKEYSQIVGGATNDTISVAVFEHIMGIRITKTIIEGDYVFLVGQTLHLNASVGVKYPIIFVDWRTYNPQNPYTIWLTYEGNWTGPLP